MFNLTVLLLVITPMLVSSEMPTRRVLGGMKAPNASVPYQVSLRKSGVGHFCGGSVITPGAILTAAHCVEGTKPELLEVVVGTNQRSAGGQSYSIRKIVSHERYEEREPDENYKYGFNVNDIAIVFTDEEIQFSDNVYAVELNDEPVRAGEELLLTGWGYTSVYLFCSDKPLTEATRSTPNRNNCVYLGHSPTDLMQLKVEAVSHEACKTALEDSIPIFKTQICAMAEEGKGACYGDSGGPLVEVKRGRQVGIVSGGLPCGTGKPDVYTSVHSFIPWIDKKLLENNNFYDDNDYQDDDSDDNDYQDDDSDDNDYQDDDSDDYIYTD